MRRIDRKAVREGNSVRFTAGEHQTVMVADPAADRMRVMVPIAHTADLPAELLMRLLQANFDSALDARYAVANEIVWGVFIHPLGSLGEDEFVSGIGQAVNIARSFGTSFSSGAVVYGGGDSQALQLRDFLEELEELVEKNRRKI